MTDEQKTRRKELRRVDAVMSKGPVDMPFLMLVLMLTVIGLIMVLSASFASAYYSAGTGHNAMYYFVRQSAFAGAGCIAMFIASRYDYHKLRKWAFPILALSVLLLAAVLVPGVGSTRGNSTRWIEIGGQTFQPSEFAKLGVILYFSSRISVEKDRLRDVRHVIWPYCAILVVIAGLMILEPHLSGTILILAIAAALLFAGGVPLPYFIAGGGVLAGGFALLVGVMGYGSSRVQLWLDPWADAVGKGYQTVQSLLAIGSGGLVGVGLGRSRQKFLYLPDEHNDFIFSIICEELGFIGAVLILSLFTMLVIRGYWIALHSRDRFGGLLVIGITTMIAVQVFLNVAVVTNFVPNTGISLPLFSYGGSALLVQLVEMGIILSVSRQMPAPKAG
jgi:cell division protein FtsW